MVRTLLLLLVAVTLNSCSAVPGTPATGTASATQQFEDAAAYRVRLRFPASWAAGEAGSARRFEGADGFVQLTAIANEAGLDAVAQALTNRPDQPYGSNPQVETVVAGPGKARLIRPWTDQRAELRGQTALIIPRNPALMIAGAAYGFLVVEADGTQAGAIFASIELIAEE